MIVGFYLSSRDDATVFDNICLYWTLFLSKHCALLSFLVVPHLARVYQNPVYVHFHTAVVYSMDICPYLLTSWASNSDMDLLRHRFPARHSIFHGPSTWPLSTYQHEGTKHSSLCWNLLCRGPQGQVEQSFCTGVKVLEVILFKYVVRKM